MNFSCTVDLMKSNSRAEYCEKMSFSESFGRICIIIVITQAICGAFRWIFGNVIGPHFGKPINFTNYGKWAGKELIIL